MIILTGGAGFIGSCLLSRLNQEGKNDVIVVDHLDDEKANNLRNKRFKDYIDKKDFLRKFSKDQITFKVDVVFHMGACSSTILDDESYYEENNFLYTQRLAQWCIEKKVKFIYASSAATYGNGSYGYSDDHALLKKYRPLNFYGESKHKLDLWALREGLLSEITGLKFFNVFGPNEYHKGEMRSLILKAYSTVVELGCMKLFKSYDDRFSDGHQKRDFIYIKDAVDVIMFFYQHPDISGIYNVGTGKARTWNDLARALFRAVDKEPEIEYIDMPIAIRDQYQYFTEADIRKLRSVGYQKPFVELEDSIVDYVKYLERNSFF